MLARKKTSLKNQRKKSHSAMLPKTIRYDVSTAWLSCLAGRLRRKCFRGTPNIAILLFEVHVQHKQYLEAPVPPDNNQTPEQIARDQ
ncbi:hypothetical protein, partial [Nioella ostreopsis]|uniref:hypothetical protein n=1 Tax=Nioella ostreopsis TaxID=2448479 RepID=UPI001980E8E9